eukprot:2544365-Rhodomonas_salina.3
MGLPDGRARDALKHWRPKPEVLIPGAVDEREASVQDVCAPILLRPCYAMSGTAALYGAICYAIRYGIIGLRACYAMSGTDRAYVARKRSPNTRVTARRKKKLT